MGQSCMFHHWWGCSTPTFSASELRLLPADTEPQTATGVAWRRPPLDRLPVECKRWPQLTTVGAVVLVSTAIAGQYRCQRCLPTTAGKYCPWIPMERAHGCLLVPASWDSMRSLS